MCAHDRCRSTMAKRKLESGELQQTVMVQHNGKPVTIYLYDCCDDGTIKGGCQNACKNKWVDVMHFAPTDGSAQSQAKHTKFVTAYDAYKAAHANRDGEECLVQLDVIVSLRTQFCAKCMSNAKKLPRAKQECKDWYDDMRKAKAIENNGCAHQDCPERGADVWSILTADHGTNPKATQQVRNRSTGEVQTKPLSISHYAAWAVNANGGVEAMKVEAQHIQKWICVFCHALEPTSRSGNRYPNPEAMPKGKARGTKQEKQQHQRRMKAKVVYPKQQYVDAAKREIGACARCKRPVISGNEAAFDFNHVDEATKCRGGLFTHRGGVCGLRSNQTGSSALKYVKVLLDAEMAKCELLCKNCHHRHTWKYGVSETES